jgi:cytochrome c-type biogenesis protein CcmH/NrfG
MKPKLVCANCAFDITHTDIFCPSCGQKIEWDEHSRDDVPVEEASTPAEQHHKIVCDVCGHQNESGRFCESCGARLESSIPDSKPSKKEKGPKRSKSRKSISKPTSAGTIISVSAAVILLSFAVYIFVIDRNAPNDHVHTPPQTGAGMDQSIAQEISRLAHELEHEPNNQEIIIRLANLYHDIRDFDNAIGHYQKYISLNSGNPDARVDLGICYFEAGQPQQAVETVQNVTEDFPDHQLAAFNLGIIYLNLGEVESANRYFKRAAEIDPNNETGQRARRIVEEHSF